ncbi:flagellar biosynthesis anti-sigma factor FlgM [Propionivibrio sp.]|uniref:flagellar biosynthesis anti-sigma factor FlgM n=1 Tax=Propionivibrio sp. TaxID=2212460 RepID=UPI0026232179|nr:flagellar biosynthesis anti-sigma factor FlgM [Propionivibrio sp.]
MKIESSSKPAGAPLMKETRAQGAHSTGKTSSANADDVQLSVLSAQLSAPDDVQSFDAARVSEIKQAISDGHFTINAGAIADHLISSARQLVDSQRRA